METNNLGYNNDSFKRQKKKIFSNYQERAKEERFLRRREHFFHVEDRRYLHFLIPEGLRVLDLGCGTGDILAAVNPSEAVGIDIIPEFIDVAKKRYPDYTFLVGDIEKQSTLDSLKGPFDVIILSDIIGELDDVQEFLTLLHPLCMADTRIVITYFNNLWRPFLSLAEKIGLKSRQVEQNWLFSEDIANLLRLSGYDEIRKDWRILFPYQLLFIGTLLNRFIAPFPLIRKVCLRNYHIARSLHVIQKELPSVSVIIPCRNEKGNVEAAIQRIPRFAPEMEIIFVEGHSSDGTLDEINRVRDAYDNWNISVLIQPGKGKADAMRMAFAIAKGDILMILDGDLTMPPEDLPKYYAAITSGVGEFINGSRLIYPMEKDAMRFLNQIANSVFSLLFTYLLNQRFTDTLCGTKVLPRKYYQMIEKNRTYFGDFDPFGDFDLIFGAVKLNMKVVEIPIRYKSRTYGTTQISRFSHGLLLIKMVIFAYKKLKVI